MPKKNRKPKSKVAVTKVSAVSEVSEVLEVLEVQEVSAGSAVTAAPAASVEQESTKTKKKKTKKKKTKKNTKEKEEYIEQFKKMEKELKETKNVTVEQAKKIKDMREKIEGLEDDVADAESFSVLYKAQKGKAMATATFMVAKFLLVEDLMLTGKLTQPQLVSFTKLIRDDNGQEGGFVKLFQDKIKSLGIEAAIADTPLLLEAAGAEVATPTPTPASALLLPSSAASVELDDVSLGGGSSAAEISDVE